jgi:transketolase
MKNIGLPADTLKAICHFVRRSAFETVLTAGSGHLGGSSSSVELMVALYFGGILRYDLQDPHHPGRDRVLVRGHLGPLRYSIFSLLGWVEESELGRYRELGSALQGHEMMDLVPGVDITPSGSLGMLLSFGVGAAVACKRQGADFRVYVFLGDGEEQEGIVSEAARHASHLGLDNLVCILDRNKKQLSHPIAAADGGVDIHRVWEGYGWDVTEIRDGHSLDEVLSVYSGLFPAIGPRLVIANTIKGAGLRDAEKHFSGYHTISVCPHNYVREAIRLEQAALAALNYTPDSLRNEIKSLVPSVEPHCLGGTTERPVEIEILPDQDTPNTLTDGLIKYLAKVNELFRNDNSVRFYGMTADLIDAPLVSQCNFGQGKYEYLDVGIREQHLLAMAHGLSITDYASRIFIDYGDAFLYRGADQLNAIALGRSKMIIVGDDGGLSGARNGATHQSSGQPGALLTMPGVTLLEPCDIYDLFNCLNWAFTNYPGLVYIRLHTAAVNLPIGSKERSINYYTVFGADARPNIVLVGSGFLAANAVEAAERLRDEQGLNARVINVINMASLDEQFVELLGEGVPVLTLYNGNHYVLQSAVATAVLNFPAKRPSIVRGHGFLFGTSGSLTDLIQHFGLSASGIIEKVWALIASE